MHVLAVTFQQVGQQILAEDTCARQLIKLASGDRMEIHNSALVTPHRGAELVRRVRELEQNRRQLGGALPERRARWATRLRVPAAQAAPADTASDPGADRPAAPAAHRRPADRPPHWRLAAHGQPGPSARRDQPLARSGPRSAGAPPTAGPSRRAVSSRHQDAWPRRARRPPRYRLPQGRNERRGTRLGGMICESVHVCIDDASRIAFSQIKPADLDLGAQGERRRLPARGCRLLRSPRRHLRAYHDRQKVVLKVRSVPPGPQADRPTPHPHQARRVINQLQGRTVRPDHPARMGRWLRLRNRRATGRTPASRAASLDLTPTTGASKQKRLSAASDSSNTTWRSFTRWTLRHIICAKQRLKKHKVSAFRLKDAGTSIELF